MIAAPQDQRPDEVVLWLDQSQDGSVELAIAQQYRLIRLEGETNALLQARIQRYRIPDRRTVAAVVGSMQGDARIVLAQPNFIHRLQGKASAAMVKLQYASTQMQLASAHGVSRGRNTRVAVIDSAIDTRHPELSGAIGGSFDATGQHLKGPDAHGTAIAGIIGARGKFKGVAPATTVLAVRAFFVENRGGPLTTTFILLRAIDWASASGAKVFNLSFSGPYDEALRRLVEAAHRRGAILVAAAGNGGPKAPAAYPAAYQGVIAVTAVDKADRLYVKANQGPYILIAAPGVDVVAPVPGSSYDFKSGTSFAAAHVSGMVALLLERDPALTLDQVRALLAAGAVDLGPKGQDALFGAGRVDAFSTVQAVLGAAVAVHGAAPVAPVGMKPPALLPSNKPPNP